MGKGRRMKLILYRSPKGHVLIEDVVLVAKAKQAIRQRDSAFRFEEQGK